MKKKLISVISLILFLLSPIGYSQIWIYGTFEQRLILVANDIDYELNKETFNIICAENDWELLRVTADQFQIYKDESFIVILGGVEAYDGIGEIVDDVLTDPQGIKTHSSFHRFLVENYWIRFQEVVILAGEDREHTKEAVETFKDKFLECYEEGIKKAFTRDFLGMYEKDLSKFKQYESCVMHTTSHVCIPWWDIENLYAFLESLEADYEDLQYILEYKIELSEECEKYISDTVDYVLNIARDYIYSGELDELNEDHRLLWRLNKDVWSVMAKVLGKIQIIKR
ncbi:MAG: hypothetical protein KAX04_03085 [Methanomicrobia archaeon]|nr:hypothetical protein [Methanomicrobia archaeon]